MKFLKLFLWSAACVGLGVALATFELGGRTPIQIVERQVKTTSARIDRVFGDGSDDTTEYRRKVSTKRVIGEQHSRRDRDEIDDIIAKRQQK